jgi:2'-5' RNA ligase
MRIFFALFPPLDTYGRFFADVFKYLDKEKRNLDFMPLEQIHLNIKFLGANVSENSLAYILQTLREFEGQYTKPEVKIKKLQFGFKHQINPNYIVADIYESDSLVSLSEEIHKLIKYLDLKDTIRWKEKHANTFHISLARKKKPKTPSLNKDLKLMMKDCDIHIPEAFVANRLDIVQSIVTNKRPVYKKVDYINL